MVKIRRTVEFEPCLHVAPLHGFSTKNSEEKTSGDNAESSHSNNAHTTSLSSSVDKQTSNCEASLWTQATLDSSNAQSTFLSGSVNKQTPPVEISAVTQAGPDSINALSTSLSGSPKKQIPHVELSLGTEATSCANNDASLSGLMNKETPHVEISVGIQVMLDSNNAYSTPLSVSMNKKNPHVDLSLGTQASSEKNNENSPSDYHKPHSSSGDVQIPHSDIPFRSQDSLEENCEDSHSNNAQLTLISCSVMFLPAYSSEDHITDSNLSSLEKDIPLIDSSSMMLNENFPQGTFNYCGTNGWTGEQPSNITHSTSSKKLTAKRNQKKYRGVTRHRWTGKYEAHLWDKSSGTEGHTRKGKQVYLGGYETEEKAAHAYDLAVLKYWGPSASTKLNFPISSYRKEIEEMENTSREEFVMSLRRKSSCFARGSSIYRGVTRYREGQWQARIKKSPGEKDTYLGTFRSEEEAARAYDIAVVKLRGTKSLTNFDISNYINEDGKELEEPSQPKRRRRRVDFAPMTTLVVASDPQPDESIMSPTIEPLLPEPPRF